MGVLKPGRRPDQFWEWMMGMGHMGRTKPAATVPARQRSGGEVRRKAEGQAAIMLIESLLLTLMDRSVLTKTDVLEAIEIVIETKRNIAADGQSADVERAAEGLLVSLANSIMSSSLRKRSTAPADSST